MTAHIDEVAYNSFVLKYFQNVTMKRYDFAKTNHLGCLSYFLGMKRQYTHVFWLQNSFKKTITRSIL